MPVDGICQHEHVSALALRRRARVGGAPEPRCSGHVVPTLCRRPGLDDRRDAWACARQRWNVPVQALPRHEHAPALALRRGARMGVGAGQRHPGQVVPTLRRERPPDDRRHAQGCARQGRRMPVQTLRQRTHASALALRRGTRVGGAAVPRRAAGHVVPLLRRKRQPDDRRHARGCTRLGRRVPVA